jgi:hypothetical protein
MLHVERVEMDIFALLDELQVIARNGLHYASDLYDRERYERLMALTSQKYPPKRYANVF